MEDDTTLTSTQPNYQLAVKEAVTQQRMLVDYLRQGMTEGIDYGVIPGTRGKTLFKPGAVKICQLFKLRQDYEVVESIVNFEEPSLVFYHFRCRLYRGNELVGEGDGSCSSKEKKYQRQTPADISNTVLKMGQKRSLIAAVVNVVGVSEVFAGE